VKVRVTQKRVEEYHFIDRDSLISPHLASSRLVSLPSLPFIMSQHYAKPENALRKAQDLVAVGKPGAAIKTMHQILINRRYRLWSNTHEKIMLYYLDLSVSLRRSVKDGLVQYRMICGQAQTASMERVLKHYQKLAEERADAAAKQAEQINASATAAVDSVRDVEDLEEASPEALQHAAEDEEVGEDGNGAELSKDRVDRAILTPWVRYLWECYRTILDVLRNNGRLEGLYHGTARAAFDFCRRFGRNMEFRRLCEILRTHLTAIAKYQNQQNSVDLSSAETQTLYLATRFHQLRVASDLELWQEAYRTIEDIHENMRIGGKQEPPPELMKTYYEKLAQIFWASSNYLFHAYSINKYFQLSAHEAATGTSAVAEDAASAPLDASERSRLASAVVLSSLIITGSQQSVELHDIDTMSGVEQEGNLRLAQLLGFKKEPPSRQRIISSVVSVGALQRASPAARKVFNLLENHFAPLTLYRQLKPLFAELSADATLTRYVAALEQVTVVRVLQQVSSVFKSMKLSKFLTLVPDVGSVFNLERLILSAINNELVSVRFDHRTMSLTFPEADLEQAPMRDELVRVSKQLIQLAHTLDSVTSPASASVLSDKVKEREHVFKLIQANLAEEHENVFLRQELIEKRKQELEKLMLDKERRENEAKQAAINARKAEEARRLQEEAARREDERRRKEKHESELRQKQQLADEMKRKIEAAAATSATLGNFAVKAEKKIQALTQDLENVDKVQLLRAQEEILRAQQRELQRRRKESARRIDYTVRAMRLEERSQLITKAEQQKIDEKEQFEADFAKYLEQDKLNHEKALKEKSRLARMSIEKSVFYDKLMARRQEQYAIEKAKQDERLAIKAEKRRIMEEKRRKEEEARERERQRQEEIERKKREEEERREAELAAERKRREEQRLAEYQAAQEEAARRRQREDEAEERERQRREERERERAPAAVSAAGERAWRGGPGAAASAAAASAGGEDRPRFGRFSDRDRDRPIERPTDRERDRPARQDRDLDFAALRNRPAPAEPERREWRRDAAPEDKERERERDRERPARWGRSDGESVSRFPARDGGSEGRFPDRGPPRSFADRDRERERDAPSRELFGSRFGGGREPQARDRDRDRDRDREGATRGDGDWRSARGGAFRQERERDGEREIRRRDDRPSPRPSPEAQKQDDDGFTTVKARR